MATTKTFPIQENVRLEQILSAAEQNLVAQGYSVQPVQMNDVSGTLTVSKDYDGVKKLIGLGSSCRATVSIQNGNTLMVNIDSEWTNKILAMAIGWFFCLVPLITGIVGCTNQSGLPNKIADALMIASTNP